MSTVQMFGSAAVGTAEETAQARLAPNPAEQPDEPYWVSPIAASDRSSEWLDRAVADLEQAARSWSSAFIVERAQIRSKLANAEELVVLENRRRIIGFLSIRSLRDLQLTRLKARYIEGTIVHHGIGGKKKFARLLQGVAGGADLHVLHTQNGGMKRSLADVSVITFPVLDCRFSLCPEICADLACMLGEIDRPGGFSPLTGITTALYGHCLYSQWPVPGEPLTPGAAALADTSGVLVVGFTNLAAAQRCLEPAPPEVRQ